MKGLRYLVCGVALVASVGASSASAANWSPTNTTLHGSQLGTGKLTTNLGGVVSCTSGTTDLRANSATPTVASTTAAANPVQFTGCTALGFGATVTTHGTWDFTAVNTTTVNATARPSVAGGFVATIVTNVPACTVRVGETTINSNSWTNGTTTLTTNSASTFPIAATTEACTTLFGTSGNLEATFSVPGASIL
jgi:hypothetical protein